MTQPSPESMRAARMIMAEASTATSDMTKWYKTVAKAIEAAKLLGIEIGLERAAKLSDGRKGILEHHTELAKLIRELKAPK